MNTLLYFGCPAATAPRPTGCCGRWASRRAGRTTGRGAALAGAAGDRRPRGLRLVHRTTRVVRESGAGGRPPSSWPSPDASRPGVLEGDRARRPARRLAPSAQPPDAVAAVPLGRGQPRRADAEVARGAPTRPSLPNRRPCARRWTRWPGRRRTGRASSCAARRGTGRHMLARGDPRAERGVGGAVRPRGLLGRLERRTAGRGSSAPGKTRDRARAGSGGAPSACREGSALVEAQGGTLYLAHVAELPDRVQARLARVLRDGEAVRGRGVAGVRAAGAADRVGRRRVGCRRGGGRIRADLCKRVAGTRIEVPPLRERREDIPLLAAGLFGRSARPGGRR